MAKLWLDHMDGRYSARELTDEEAAGHDYFDVAHLPDTVWEAYLRHCDRDATWQTLWRSISNEQYIRRRQHELMPLEDAEREIARLRDELARSQRMEKFFEQENHRLLHDRHRGTYVEYTCVFPVPGCDVSVLPPKWREAAQDILDGYSERHAAEGMKIQGCCCGHDHEKLDEATADQLRQKGFVVEHDSEELP